MRHNRAPGASTAASVLVCSEERHIVRLVQVNLERQGWRVVTAHSGNTAIAQLRQELPTLLVLDSELFDPTYREVIQELRQLPDSDLVKIIVIRCDAEGDDDDGDDGITSFLRKPFNLQDMLK